MSAVMAYFHPALSFQREQKHASRLWRFFCVMLTSKNRKFCKIRSSALVGGIALQRSAKNRKFRNDLLKNRSAMRTWSLMLSFIPFSWNAVLKYHYLGVEHPQRPRGC